VDTGLHEQAKRCELCAGGLRSWCGAGRAGRGAEVKLLIWEEYRRAGQGRGIQLLTWEEREGAEVSAAAISSRAGFGCRWVGFALDFGIAGRSAAR
jgi:hypothetical protein